MRFNFFFLNIFSSPHQGGPRTDSLHDGERRGSSHEPCTYAKDVQRLHVGARSQLGFLCAGSLEVRRDEASPREAGGSLGGLTRRSVSLVSHLFDVAASMKDTLPVKCLISLSPLSVFL